MISQSTGQGSDREQGSDRDRGLGPIGRSPQRAEEELATRWPRMAGTADPDA